MRELKFRAWHFTRKEMYYDVGIDAGNTVPRCIDSQDIDMLDMVRFEDVELMQFTGLKDKNGKEVYEEDIVTINTKETFDGNKNYLIIFKEGSFGSWLEDEGYLLLVGDYYSDAIEIIGNKYENPELVEEG